MAGPRRNFVRVWAPELHNTLPLPFLKSAHARASSVRKDKTVCRPAPGEPRDARIERTARAQVRRNPSPARSHDARPSRSTQCLAHGRREQLLGDLRGAVRDPVQPSNTGRPDPGLLPPPPGPPQLSPAPTFEPSSGDSAQGRDIGGRPPKKSSAHDRGWRPD